MMKHLLHTKEFQLDEILFQGKNQAYGAYNLRAESDKFLTKAMFVGVFFVGLATATPMIINMFKPAELEAIDRDFGTAHEIILPPDTDVVPPKALDAVQPQVQKVKTVNTSVPTPTRDALKDDAPATLDQRKDAVSGTETIDAPPAINTYVPSTTIPVGPTTTVPTLPDVVKPIDNTPLTRVDVEANFQGGIEAFRSKVMSSFSTSDFEDVGGKMSTVVTFIVERDGTISGIQAKGASGDFNKEAERTILKVKGKWVPAQVKGQPVRSYFRFPISMLFE